MPGSTLPYLHIVGDSISMFYGPFLEKMLRGVMLYSRKEGTPPGDWDSANGGDSAMVLDYLRERAQPLSKIDLLLVNCGLHDIKMNPGAEGHQVPIERYVQNLWAILSLSREMGSSVIWVRTTPVDDEIHNSRSTFQRFESDVERYNAVADNVMAEHGIPVIDLFTFTCNLGQDLYCDHVHFVEAVRVQQAAFIAGRLFDWAVSRGG